jgi:hypothetical protein
VKQIKKKIQLIKMSLHSEEFYDSFQTFVKNLPPPPEDHPDDCESCGRRRKRVSRNVCFTDSDGNKAWKRISILSKCDSIFCAEEKKAQKRKRKN